MTLYCATTNPGKMREFRLALEPAFEVRNLPNASAIPAPEESGLTFEENVILKAVYYSQFCDEPLFADDSGLEVDALNGAPGVYSARYAGPDATDADNNRLVLERMSGVQNRAARFVCFIALAQKQELIRTFRGIVEGELLDQPRGANGFGYDPLFYYPPFGCSFGEASTDAKMRVSHRAAALSALSAFLR